nr:2030_t:CDS:2 [Entrophospora candida]
MSANRPSRHHGFRNHTAADQDRLKRALLQPVQAWEKKWIWTSSKHIKIKKWMKSDRKLTFNDDDEGGFVNINRNPTIEDIPTPTASFILQTDASTPQPSETETDSNLLRPLQYHLNTTPKAPSLLRESSLTSGGMSTPGGDTLTINNNDTPNELELYTDNNSPEEIMELDMNDDEDQLIHHSKEQIEGSSININDIAKRRSSKSEFSDKPGIETSNNKKHSRRSGFADIDENDDEIDENIEEQQNQEYDEYDDDQFEDYRNVEYANQTKPNTTDFNSQFTEQTNNNLYTTQVTAYIDQNNDLLSTKTVEVEDGEVEDDYNL